MQHHRAAKHPLPWEIHHEVKDILLQGRTGWQGGQGLLQSLDQVSTLRAADEPAIKLEFAKLS
jgi:hypothetical protein